MIANILSTISALPPCNKASSICITEALWMEFSPYPPHIKFKTHQNSVIGKT